MKKSLWNPVYAINQHLNEKNPNTPYIIRFLQFK